MGILAVASWLIFDNMLYQYIFKIYYIDGILGYLVIMLAPAFLTITLTGNRNTGIAVFIRCP